MTGPYYKTVFCETGDAQAVPDADPGNGTVCYDVGYNPRQELPYTDPQATNVIREQENEILKGITQNLQNWQQFGIPPFITTAINGGTPFSYAKGAQCRFGSANYESFIDNNTDQNPSTSANWWEVVKPSVMVAERTVSTSTTPIDYDKVLWSVTVPVGGSVTGNIAIPMQGTTSGTNFELRTLAAPPVDSLVGATLSGVDDIDAQVQILGSTYIIGTQIINFGGSKIIDFTLVDTSAETTIQLVMDRTVPGEDHTAGPIPIITQRNF